MKNFLIIFLLLVCIYKLCSQNCEALFSYTADSTYNVVFTDLSTSQSGTVISWFWNFGDGTSSTLQNSTHQYNQGSANFFVCLTISTNDSCTATFCDSVFFNSINPCDSFLLTYNIVNTSGPVQSDGSITTQISGGTPPYYYQWSNNDFTADISNLTVGLYCVTVTDDNSCEIIQCMNVVVDTSQIVYCISNFTYIPAYCPNCYGFSDGSTASGNILLWFWDFGDGNTSTLQNPEHAFLDSGMYNVCLIIMTDDSCSGTFCDSLYTPYSLVTYSISGQVRAGVNLLTNGTVELYDTNLPENHPPLYSQNVVNGDYFFPDVASGTYKMLATPDSPLSQNFAPTFFGNTTNFNNAYILSLYFDLISVDIGLQPNSNDINDFSDHNCSMFPNPVDDILNISLNPKYNGAIQIEIMDITGKIVLNPVISKTISNSLINIDLSSLDDGLYLIRILHDNLKSVDKLIIKKK
ncbi:MAG: PKD domain-containing protein [Bacteroidota bacterium]